MSRTALVAAASWIVLVSVWTGTPGEPAWWRDLAVGTFAVVAGTIAATRTPAVFVGRWLVVAGVAWFVGNLARVELTLVADVASAGRFAHRGALAVATVAAVAGRPPRWAAPLALATLVPALMLHPSTVLAWGVAAVLVAVACGAARRPVRLTSYAPVLVLATVCAVTAAFLRFAPDDPAFAPVYEAGIVTVVAASLAAALADRVRASRVTDAVVELAVAPRRGVGAMIGDALGCGPIEVAFAASEGWVDELGLPRSPLEPTPGASVVDVVVDGAVVARFRCPTHVAFDTDVVLGVERATAIATEHVQLRAGLREQATALAASSRRVLVAADEQRVELSRQLDVSTSDLIAEIEAAVVDLAAHVDTGELQEALRDGGRRVRELRDELDALTSGLGPTALAAGDLRGALAALAATVDVPTALRIDVDDVPPEVASALYFVVAELVTNAVRHAKATTVAITARIADGSIITEVVDDGIGGAHIEAGRGLRGLVDRVDAFGGRIELRSAAGQGTSAVVSLPVSASPTRVHGTA